MQKIVKYMIALLVAAGLCQMSFTLVEGSSLVKTLMKIVLCSIVTNAVFLLMFFRTSEFQMLKHFAGRIFEKILRRK